jgi:predicted ATP-dependent serine protease
MASPIIAETIARRIQATNPRHNDLKFFRAADVSKRAVDWLWPGRIAIGKVTLLVGDPGLGKSLVAIDVAARVSRGASWPDIEQGTESPQPGAKHAATSESGSPLHASRPLLRPPASAVLLSAEDDLADTILPRLEASRADCNRVFVLPSLADLRNDFGQLQTAINRMNDCRIIVIDPINAYVGPTDSQFQTIVRKILTPLVHFAASKRMAVLAVTHLRKHEGAAIYRAMGSMGVVAAARAVWTVCGDRNNPGRHLMVPVKNNLAGAVRGLAYTI